MLKVFRLLNEVRKDEQGATMVEYALLLGLISIAAVLVISKVGTAVNAVFNTACGSLSTVSSVAC